MQDFNVQYIAGVPIEKFDFATIEQAIEWLKDAKNEAINS